MIDQIREEYIRMLQLPFGSHERIYGQRHMSFLRDLIADFEGRSDETVQCEYEDRYNWRCNAA